MSKNCGNWRGSFKHRMLWVAIYALYLAIVLISINVFIAEDSIDDITNNMDEKYTYNLIFSKAGETTHYDVTLHNNATPGKISLTYWTTDNKLDISKLENIKTLNIDVKSMFEDESMKVFKKSSSSSLNLHLDYWLEAGDGVFTVEFNIDEYEPLEELTFSKFPEPESVRVNNQEWWKSSTNYERSGEEITISDIPTGKTTVILYFKEANNLPTANFLTTPANYAGVNENVTFNASTSTDTDGKIASWVWKFGDSTTDSGITVAHKYSIPGTYTIRLTVRDDSVPFGEDWLEKNITVAFGAEEDSDADGLRDMWEWDNFGSLDERTNDDPDDDGATNQDEHDAGTNPNDAESKPSETDSGKKGTGDGDYMGIIILVIIVIIVLVILMSVFKSKKSKSRTKGEGDEDAKAVSKMEEQIERAKKMGLPTGDLQKLLIEAKGGTVSETKSSKKSGKRHDGSSRQSKGAGRDTRGKSRSATGQKSGSRHHRKK